jgi:hypothetical protein
VVPPKGGKRYDIYRVQKSDGTMTDVWFLITGGIEDLFSALASDDYPLVELPGAATDAGDGFRIKFDIITLAKRTPAGVEYISAVYDVDVPRRVGKTQLDQVALEVFGKDGRTLTYAPLESQKDQTRTYKFHVSIDRETVGQSDLHCTYFNPASDKVAKQYVIHLKYHLPD